MLYNSCVTDYDCWKQDSSQHASVEQVILIYKKSIVTAKKLLSHLLTTSLPHTDEKYRRSLDTSMLTHIIPKSKQELISVLRV